MTNLRNITKDAMKKSQKLDKRQLKQPVNSYKTIFAVDNYS